MSKGTVNKVILVGNLGKDPEVRYTPSGLPVANLSLATSESWKDKQTGNLQERTEWHRIVLYQRLAEIAAEYLKKGAKIFVEGKLQTRKWQDKTSGQDRYSTEIVADTLQMLDARSNLGGAAFDLNQNNVSDDKVNAHANIMTDNTFDHGPINLDDDIPF